MPPSEAATLTTLDIMCKAVKVAERCGIKPEQVVTGKRFLVELHKSHGLLLRKWINITSALLIVACGRRGIDADTQFAHPVQV